MKLVDLTCPKCNATLQVNPDLQRCICQYCGNEMLIDHEIRKHHVEFSNGFEFGYQQEMGRQQAFRDAQRQQELWNRHKQELEKQRRYDEQQLQDKIQNNDSKESDSTLDNISSTEEEIIFALECVFTFFGLIFTVRAFGNSVKAGFMVLLSAIIISPVVYRFLGYFFINRPENNRGTKVGMQIMFSLLLLFFGFLSSFPSAKNETTPVSTTVEHVVETIPETDTEEDTTEEIAIEEITIEPSDQSVETQTEAEPENMQEITEEVTEAVAEQETTIPETEPEKEVGKNPDNLSLFKYSGNVRNDVTGNWRYAMFSEAGTNFAEYAVSYYKKYMKEDEIHAVINTADRTTTKVTYSQYFPDVVSLTVYSYVSGEEHDAKLMFSGSVIAYYSVNIETGEVTQE